MKIKSIHRKANVHREFIETKEFLEGENNFSENLENLIGVSFEDISQLKKLLESIATEERPSLRFAEGEEIMAAPFLDQSIIPVLDSLCFYQDNHKYSDMKKDPINWFWCVEIEQGKEQLSLTLKSSSLIRLRREAVSRKKSLSSIIDEKLDIALGKKKEVSRKEIEAYVYRLEEICEDLKAKIS